MKIAITTTPPDTAKPTPPSISFCVSTSIVPSLNVVRSVDVSVSINVKGIHNVVGLKQILIVEHGLGSLVEEFEGLVNENKVYDKHRSRSDYKEKHEEYTRSKSERLTDVGKHNADVLCGDRLLAKDAESNRECRASNYGDRISDDHLFGEHLDAVHDSVSSLVDKRRYQDHYVKSDENKAEISHKSGGYRLKPEGRSH